MQMIEELKKAIYAKYLTTTLWTTDGYWCYQDHVPQSVAYPIVVFIHVSSVNKYAMPTTTVTNGFDYVDVRMQFSIYGNDRQNATIEDIADRIEDTYHKTQLVLGDGCTNIGTLILGARTKFWDQDQKIWGIHQDFKFMCGK